MDQSQLEKGYEPHDVERRWYAFWEKEQLFAADDNGRQKPYSIVIPPPNVTGVLHMGHALNVTMQDILCRYRKLCGDNVLWMPGTDHAGIATQNVVEKKLAREGLDRHQIGRKKFIEMVWEWRREYGGAIINQLKRLGAMCDWKRERFTMDEGLSQAVRKVFVDLFHEGLIYRGDRIINWCHRCHTALADLEVDHEDIDGHMYHIRYPFSNSSREGLVVATTRPETMLGDTAVAVNPDDERYRNLQAETVILPLMNKAIPIIRDHYVDTGFGTGALKVTPAHDPNDFEIGDRHNLPRVKVIGDDGKMTTEAGSFEGLDRFECRRAVVDALKADGLLEKIEPYRHSVGHCYRCKTVVEPNLSKQWFIKAKPLAEKAIATVKSGETRIVPDMWNKTFFEWMYNIKDWCISRQIWWGHQIPAWTCQACGEFVVAMEEPEKCTACGDHQLVRETDVLDTWFSSALWPFSTLGWPEKTPLLKQFYPTAVLVTGFDILFFWVARMMMMGNHFLGDVPFRDVYVHALVRDEAGQKMSKSKGNIIDPVSIIDQYGTDAFRFTLAAFAAQGRDIKMSEKRVEGYRNFVNKLWNAARLTLMHVKSRHELNPAELSLADKWILSRLKNTAVSVARAIDGYQFNDAAATLYQFIWHEFCDWYLEIIKPELYGKEGPVRQDTAMGVLWRVLHDTLILLHPIMPFVTEEIWHKLPGTDGSIMTARFPLDRPDETGIATDSAAETQMGLIINTITGIRNIRGEMNIAPSRVLDAIVHTDDSAVSKLLQAYDATIKNLARLDSLTVSPSGPKPDKSATVILEQAAIYVPLEGVVDFSTEVRRLEKEMRKIDAELKAINAKLENPNFMTKAPQQIVSQVKAKHEKLLAKEAGLKSNIDRIRTFIV